MNVTEITNHATVAALVKASAILNALDDSVKSKSAVAELIARIDYLNWVFEQTDSALISLAELDALVGYAQNINTYIASVAANPVPNAQAAGQQIDVYFTKFPYPRFKKIPRAESKQIIEQVQAQADQLIGELKARTDAVKSTVSVLDEAITGQKANVADLQAQVASIEERQAVLSKDANTFSEKTITTLDGKIDERLVEANARLSNAIDEFQAKITDDRSKANVQLSEIAADRKSAAELADRTLTEATNKLISDGKEYLQKIREIYGIVGGEASSGQLTVSANGEAQAYKILGFAAFVAFTIGSYIAYQAIQPALASGVDWHVLLGRVGLVLASYIPAWFLASLASKHRQAELAYRSLAVRVAAFDPYVSEFEQSDRVGLKKELAEMFFSPSLNKQKSDTFGLKDLKDFERVIAPLEAIFDKIKSMATRT